MTHSLANAFPLTVKEDCDLTLWKKKTCYKCICLQCSVWLHEHGCLPLFLHLPPTYACSMQRTIFSVCGTKNGRV